jgi:hypothetical protein
VQTDPFEKELSQYIRVNDDSTALEFWMVHQKEYPLLSKMAQIYSGICPGSVPVESLFSCAGYKLNNKRSMSALYKADMLTFINDNFDVVMETE